MNYQGRQCKNKRGKERVFDHLFRVLDYPDLISIERYYGERNRQSENIILQWMAVMSDTTKDFCYRLRTESHCCSPCVRSEPLGDQKFPNTVTRSENFRQSCWCGFGFGVKSRKTKYSIQCGFRCWLRCRLNREKTKYSIQFGPKKNRRRNEKMSSLWLKSSVCH